MKGSEIKKMARPKGSTNKATEEKKLAKEQEMKDMMHFAEISMVGKPISQSSKNKSYSKIDKDALDRMLQNPKVNYQKLQDFSEYLSTTSGLYQRLTKYLPYILTYNFMIIRKSDSSRLLDKASLQKAFEKSAMYMDKLNPKTNLPWMAYDLFLRGELYVYKVEDGNGLEYKVMPNKMCMPYSKTNNVMQYVIDMTQLNMVGDSILTYPTEIQNAYSLYRSKDGSKNPIFLEGKWYQVSENGVGFILNNRDSGHGVPPFASTFSDIINVDEAKSLQKTKTELDASKMVFFNIPLDSSSRPILPPAITNKYLEAVEKDLPDGCMAIVNPLLAEVLQLGDTSQRTNNITSESISQFFDSIGISSMLFANDKSSAESLKKSVITDVIWVINELLTMFSAYYDKELTDNVSGNVKYKTHFLDTTHYDKETYRKQCGTELAYGGSKMEYWASCGYTPYEAWNLYADEKTLELKDLFIPVESSHTTANSEGGVGGKPKSEGDISTSTEVSRNNGNR